jgi:hypothetical protein
MKTNYCINCGTEQGYVGEINDYIYCERCGAKIYGDGSVSYDSTQESREQMNENIDFYDSGERDRNDYYRHRRR